MLAGEHNPQLFIDAMVQRFVKNEDLPKVGGLKLKKQAVVDMLDLKEASEFVEAARAVDLLVTQGFSEVGEIVNGEGRTG